MQIFYGLVHKEPDSAFGVEFPDVPGCYSASDDEGALLANACDALICHLEGEEVPEPSGIDFVRSKCASELEAGAFLLAVPYIETSAKTVRANISLDEGTLAAIDAAAKARNMTRSVFIAHSTRHMIEGRFRMPKTDLKLSFPDEVWKDPEGNVWIIHEYDERIGQIRMSRAPGNRDSVPVKTVSVDEDGWEKVNAA